MVRLHRILVCLVFFASGFGSAAEVVLGSGASGVGWVVDEAEAPVAGADVRLVPVESGEPRRYRYGWGPEHEEDLVSSATDAEGHFRFTNLAAGRYNLEVEAAGFAPVTVPGLVVELEPGEQDFGTVVLETGTRLEGTVLDPQGSPVADAEVFISPC